ncbi:hypothetical protein J2Y68_001276 [Paenarthrobacter nitroguajacolicus]|nr:hypothetical protein [Paenarthrobacter nitroguajacolicus]
MTATPEWDISRHASGKSGKQLRKDRLFLLALGCGLLLVTVGLLVVPIVTLAYDETHHVAIECTVTGAKGGLASGGGTWSRVQILTSDCGTLTMTKGISESNRDAVAAEITPGRRFLLQVGATEHAMWDLYQFFRITPSVYSVQRAE